MVKSHFSFISYADIVQVFQSMFLDDMIANKWSLAVFGIRPYLMESIKRKIKKKIYMFFY